jgi:hypothetical protein
MEGWKVGKMEKWKNGKLECWNIEALTEIPPWREKVATPPLPTEDCQLKTAYCQLPTYDLKLTT